MFGFFGFILIIFIVIIFIGLSIVGNIIRLFFKVTRGKSSKEKKQTYTKSEDYESYQDSNQSHKSHNKSAPGHKRKIFGDDEGEYVDFTEVK